MSTQLDALERRVSKLEQDNARLYKALESFHKDIHNGIRPFFKYIEPYKGSKDIIGGLKYYEEDNNVC